MAANPPHLLTLPREIRNQIYSYLHKEVVVHTRREPSVSVVQLRLENMPYMSVLLINSQIYYEYREADCVRNLAARIDLSFDFQYWTQSPFMVRQPKVSALSFVRHVTIVDKRPNSVGLVSIETFLENNMPMLRTVRYLEGFALEGLAKTCVLHDSKLFSDWPLTHFDTDEQTVAGAFLGLPLVQMAVAKRVEFYHPCLLGTDPFSTWQLVQQHDPTGLFHAITTMKFVSYTIDDPKKYTWTPEQGNDCWPSRCPYPQDVLDSLTPEKQAQIARLSTALVNWKEGCIVTEAQSLTTPWIRPSDDVKVTFRDAATENEE